MLDYTQIPVSVGVAMYEAVGLLQGKRVISSKANDQTSLKVHQLLLYCFLGLMAGVVAGLLGVGGGSIMGPLFLELGVPPQVKYLLVHLCASIMVSPSFKSATICGHCNFHLFCLSFTCNIFYISCIPLK